MDERLCSLCGNTFPLDRQHFRWFETNGKGKFSSVCLTCRAQQKRASKERKRAKRTQALQGIEEAGVDILLGTATNGGANIPHSAEVIERVFQYFGGVAGFSAVVVKQYWDSPPGGTARNRLIETLCRLVTKNVESGGAKKPLSLWTEEELEAELNSRFEEALAGFKGKVINVTPEEPRRIVSKEAEDSPQGYSPGNPDGASADPVPAGQPARPAKRTPRKKARSPEALPPDSPAGEGA
jgi:hypothetical protein